MAVYPEVGAFDLDYTVWPCYCDTHLAPPFTPVKKANGEVHTVVDARGFELSFYDDIPRIITDLKEHGAKIISASRTWAPEIAKELLNEFKVKYNGKLVTLGELFDATEWGERSKVGHIGDGLKKIYGNDNLRKYKICLFDDESRNKDVEKFGVKFIYVRDPEKGPSWKLYQDYINNEA
ncbi:similar to Saccharomyces cerevisiae YER134C Magnesium-dependent acid phosphatase, member of the haloacid dehalogenase superfamily [Maudiozyma saulgeensis]|uniref:Similar to Saccharomyces cerevisiae YER134C Magnesium-dependent acid phosphatase, member of the haloacid dehalogenase superfamily n=1 Tax=Maudiozyma saulgeensis TaxID=1789683 RepID=A0A1X7QYA2_9SACH|nr:similar to Saccharomyces cerevisiae YER134C Magnesium-dependent acid phosphatase, member of the haloacid dehalogenase superfamily [Kazachstania saulgeensis]